MSLAPPPPPKHGIAQSTANGATDDSGFSVSAAKAFFEAAKKPEVRNAATSLAKNQYVQSMAKSAAQNPETRRQIAEAISKPTPAQKMAFNAAVAASASSASSAAVPPPPPHRATSNNSSSDYRPAPPPMRPSTTSYSSSSNYSSASAAAPSKSIASSHSSIMSKLEGMHLGGQSPATQTAPSYDPPASSYTPSFTSLPSSTYVSPTEPHAIAKYPFAPSNFDELACVEGDTILLKKEVDADWIYGMNTTTGKHGIIPISFLTVKVPLAPTSSLYAAQSNTATAIYDYASSTPGDLQFRASDVIAITGKVDDQWLEGELAGRRGIFPITFVQLNADLSRIPFTTQNSAPAAASPSSNQLNLDVYSGKKKKEFLIGAYSYMSGVEGDLQFSKGELFCKI
ncbi:hypothetical protein WR25_02011 isoform D [Diploscapter pachys]|uniref:SH3 domain-containing protein n=1 Tax=Diploscapter pachys TaxID=2018661 RepID=A0A2A2KMD8_9BILA|nr:hypothetical protein WR25_02011 isoform B [Diploscapter pachys]PAV75168.1 hypothetical protein WR25_02011 isoform D [Diploscapter pachys]